MAKTTAMASGVNRYRAVPVSSSTGTNTIQIEIVATKVGTAICDAPSSTARIRGLRMAMLRCVFSISTVASSTRMPTARARPPERHHVDGLAQQAQDAERGEDGERNGNADDERAAPASQKQQDHQTGQTGGDQRLADHALNGCAHEDRLIGERRDLQFRRDVGENAGSAAFTALTMARVEALPFRVMVIKTPRGAIGAHDIVLHRIAVMHLRHVLDVDGCAVHRFDGQVVQIVQQDAGCC